MPLLDLWTSIAVVTVIAALYSLTSQWLEHRHERQCKRLDYNEKVVAATDGGEPDE